jgi:hypothetical protein
MTTKIKKTREQREAERVERLRDAVLSITSEQGFRLWAKARRSFHNYSFRNQILIAIQTPLLADPDGDEDIETAERCTAVAGYRRWQEKFNRQVLKGAKSIVILAPVKKWVTDETSGEREKRVVGWRDAYVFDVSQTFQIAGKEEVPLSYPYTVGSPEGGGLPAETALARMEALARSCGSEVTYPDAIERGEADFHPTTLAIRVTRGEPLDMLTRLTHETAHLLDHTTPGKPEGYSVGEQIAESACYLALTTAGVDMDAHSIPYIANWSHDDEDVSRLSEWAARIHALASRLEGALAPDERSDTTEDA